MDKVLELANKAGIAFAGYNEGIDEQAPSEGQLQYFYTLARADLKADLAATRDLAEGYAQERNELKAENAKLLDALDTAITVIEEYQAASIRQGFSSPAVKKLREARGEK